MSLVLTTKVNTKKTETIKQLTDRYYIDESSFPDIPSFPKRHIMSAKQIHIKDSSICLFYLHDLMSSSVLLVNLCGSVFIMIHITRLLFDFQCSPSTRIHECDSHQLPPELPFSLPHAKAKGNQTLFFNGQAFC